MNAVYISKIKEKDSELKALESQINPHFLYNTLDLVSWLALLDGNERIATLVSSLSDMMRYNIKNNNKLVTIAQEIEHIKNYMNILFIRHNDKFDINIDIPAQLTSVKIPKLILQPLVENSILHGFQTMSKKGYISIKGNIENSNIIITVEDNGIGANPDSLNAFLFGDNDSNIHTDSYGIKNVHERIRLNFGEAYGLSYKKNDSTGITAIITLPNAQ
jgi:two-component system sensor histidine kinase YesM